MGLQNKLLNFIGQRTSLTTVGDNGKLTEVERIFDFLLNADIADLRKLNFENFGSLGEYHSILLAILDKYNTELSDLDNTRKQENFLNEFSSLLYSYGGENTELYTAVSGMLARQLNLNQVGIFVISEEDNADYTIQLQACYAYEKRRFLEKKLEKGQGLIGQAILEKDIIYLTDVPQYYTHITSGLGEATPAFIAIVPIMDDTEVNGAIELASFTALSNKDKTYLLKVSKALYQWIEKEKHASGLEESKILAEEARQALVEKEEEMKMRIEELDYTNTELQMNKEETSKLLEQLAEKNKELEIIKQNESLLLKKKLDAQQASYELIIKTLKSKLSNYTQKNVKL